MSMIESELLPATGFYNWFKTTIYYFHVPLFFICSGYLYQKYSKVFTIKDYGKNVLKKFIALGVPYFVFTAITVGLKKIFSSSVNTEANGWIDTLFLNPTAPYWYLYALFFIFVVSPTMKSKTAMDIFLGIALVLKVVIVLPIIPESVNLPYAVSTVMKNLIWFAFGMCAVFYEWHKRIKWHIAAIIFAVFICLSVIVHILDVEFYGMSFLLGCVACFSVVSFTYSITEQIRNEKVKSAWSFCAKYTMPLFLMHTIFAAGLRAVLFKIGITIPAVHIALGLIITFAGPILAAWIMNKTKFLEFVLYPTKFIKIK